MGRRRKHHKNFPPHLQIKKGRFYYVVMLRGKPRWFPLKTSDEGEALKRWAEVESELNSSSKFDLSEIELETDTRITFSVLKKRYIAEEITDKADSTQGDDRRRADVLEAKFGKTWVHKMTRQEIIRYHDSLRAVPYEANRRLSLLHHMLRKAKDWGYLTVNPADGIERFKEKRHKLKLTVDVLFNKIYPVADEMLKRAIMLGFHLVQHEMEVKRLEWSNFDLEARTVAFTRQKADADIPINFSEDTMLVRYMEHLKAHRKDLSPYLIYYHTKVGFRSYASFRSMWERALVNAKYEKGSFQFKEIRHLANTTMKDEGITADKRKGMTGHKTAAANEIYTHPTAKDTLDASRALGDYGPSEF
jgi:integrase